MMQKPVNETTRLAQRDTVLSPRFYTTQWTASTSPRCARNGTS